MNEHLSQIKMHLSNLDEKYPANKITYSDESRFLNIDIDGSSLELDYELINAGFDEHGTKFANAIIDMIENNMIKVADTQ